MIPKENSYASQSKFRDELKKPSKQTPCQIPQNLPQKKKGREGKIKPY